MIVRISGEDQFELPDDDAARLNELETAVAGAIEQDSADAFPGAYSALLDYVRAHGRRVADDELQGSDVILPPADITLAEARGEFTGEGLIPD